MVQSSKGKSTSLILFHCKKMILLNEKDQEQNSLVCNEETRYFETVYQQA